MDSHTSDATSWMRALIEDLGVPGRGSLDGGRTRTRTRSALEQKRDQLDSRKMPTALFCPDLLLGRISPFQQLVF